jgi:hypothetical protein
MPYPDTPVVEKLRSAMKLITTLKDENQTFKENFEKASNRPSCMWHVELANRHAAQGQL